MTDISTMSADAVYGAVDASQQADERRQRAMRSQLVSSWLRDRAAVDPRFEVYFDESDAADHWFGREQRGFRNALLRYVHLACCDHAMRDDRLLNIQRVPCRQRGVGGAVGGAMERPGLRPAGALSVDPAFVATYRWLGNQLLHQRRVMLDQLLAANGKGFSTGWRDFVGDLNPLG